MSIASVLRPRAEARIARFTRDCEFVDHDPVLLSICGSDLIAWITGVTDFGVHIIPRDDLLGSTTVAWADLEGLWDGPL